MIGEKTKSFIFPDALVLGKLNNSNSEISISDSDAKRLVASASSGGTGSLVQEFCSKNKYKYEIIGT